MADDSPWRPTDQAIMDQTREIAQKEIETLPLLTDATSLDALELEYQNADEQFGRKVQDLSKRYSKYRKTRPDGNCFFRAFGFAILERLFHNLRVLQYSKTVDDRISRLTEKWRDLIGRGNYQWDTVEYFYDPVHNLIKSFPGMKSIDLLLAEYQIPEISDGFVVFLRFLTSAYIKTNQAYFSFLWEYDGITAEDWCSQEIDCYGKESDEAHIVGAVNALGFPCEIIYLDRSEGTSANVHPYLPAYAGTCVEMGDGEVPTLLYR